MTSTTNDRLAHLGADHRLGPSQRFGSRHRSGFTLLELMLVLAVLAAVAAMAWPILSRSFEHVRLTKAAEQVQAAWGKARVQAMSTGLPHVFRFEANTGSYSVVPWEDESAAIEASMPMASGVVAASTSTASAASTTYSGAATTTGPQLPEGVVFTGIERTSDSRVLAADTELAAAGIVATSPPVVFYPDGTASDAVLTVANENGRSVSISLRGLTGISRIGDVVNGQGVLP